MHTDALLGAAAPSPYLCSAGKGSDIFLGAGLHKHIRSIGMAGTAPTSSITFERSPCRTCLPVRDLANPKRSRACIFQTAAISLPLQANAQTIHSIRAYIEVIAL